MEARLEERGDVINLIPQPDGSVRRREVSMNAVIIQVQPDGGRLISIECKDEAMLPALREEARRIIGF